MKIIVIDDPAKLQEENKALYQQLLYLKTDYLKRMHKVAVKGETSLNQQIKDLVVQFDQGNTLFYDKIRLLKIEDVDFKREYYRLEDLQKHFIAEEETKMCFQ